MDQNKTKRNKTHIELLRIIAMYFVLFNHTWIYGFSYFNSIVDQPTYWISLFFSILVKVDVPIFFMISGALLLPKDESIKKVFERFLKTLAALILFSLVSFIYALPNHDITLFSAGDFLLGVYQGTISGQYWFLYRYLGFLLLLPILRPMVKSLSNNIFKYILALFLTVECITIIQYVLSNGSVTYNGSFQLFLLQDLIIFPIAGYFIENRLLPENYSANISCKLILLSIMTIGITCVLTRYHCELIGEWSESTCQVFFNTLIIIPTITLYYSVKVLFIKHDINEKLIKIITAVGSTIFGVYLLEQIYRDITFDVYTALNPIIGSVPASLIWVLCALILGCAITFILKKISYLNKII